MQSIYSSNPTLKYNYVSQLKVLVFSLFKFMSHLTNSSLQLSHSMAITSKMTLLFFAAVGYSGPAAAELLGRINSWPTAAKKK